MASKWSLFGISFGSLLVLLSYMADTPIPVIVSGVTLMLFSAYLLFRNKKNAR